VFPHPRLRIPLAALTPIAALSSDAGNRKARPEVGGRAARECWLSPASWVAWVGAWRGGSAFKCRPFDPSPALRASDPTVRRGKDRPGPAAAHVPTMGRRKSVLVCLRWIPFWYSAEKMKTTVDFWENSVPKGDLAGAMRFTRSNGLTLNRGN